jgi:hypothetical protein
MRHPHNPDEETILSSLRQLTATTAATEEKVEILHPLLELLQSPDPTLSNYAKHIIKLLTQYEARMASMERTISGMKEDLQRQSSRLQTLLSLLEAPVPE